MKARHELMCELGIAQQASGDTDACNATFIDGDRGDSEAGNGASSFARAIERAYVTSSHGAGGCGARAARSRRGCDADVRGVR